MSNSLAIGAVTATLRQLLAAGIAAEGGGIGVTTLPPDKAHMFGQADGPGRLNLFLYQTQHNAAWRNSEMPRQVAPNETGSPPLALDLYYLLTAYEKTDGDPSVFAHRLLGRGMRVLHDHPLLGAAEIRAALADSDLADQIERVRVTPQPLSLEEISKLWTIFQAGYRISAAYRASVVLIDSTRPARTPLPVLRRGEDDRGVNSQPDLTPPFPSLLELAPPAGQACARLGEELTIRGVHLGGDSVAVRLTGPRLSAPRIVPAAGGDEEVKMTVPDDPAHLPAGSYTLAVRVQESGQPDRFTNDLPLQIAPEIAGIDPATAPAGDLTLRVTCRPDLLPQQRTSLLLGDREVLAQPRPARTNTAVFQASAVAKGQYFLRLRVDGVDSLLAIRAGMPPVLQFDPAQKVTVT